MSMLSIFNVSGSAASAQSQRLNVVASNLANADTVAAPNGQAYKARQVTFQTQLMGAGRRRRPGRHGRRRSRQHHRRGPDARPPRPRPQAPERRCRRLRHLQQRQRGRGDGQHDLGLPLVPEQPRGDEHREDAPAEDASARAGLIAMATAAVANNPPSPFAALQSMPVAKAAVDDAKATSERFLKLLVAQMQNQDPLSPMDNAQVTSQMAQINTVSGIEKLNTTVQALSAQFAQTQAVQGAALVGKDVVVAGNRLDIVATADASGAVANVAQGGFELSGAADAVKVEILAPSGAVMQTINLGAEGAGMHSFDWPPARRQTPAASRSASALSAAASRCRSRR
jgi:flagellar basal-body rod modification protein FlgD